MRRSILIIPVENAEALLMFADGKVAEDSDGVLSSSDFY